MTEFDKDFKRLMEELGNGSEDAAAELVATYGDTVRAPGGASRLESQTTFNVRFDRLRAKCLEIVLLHAQCRPVLGQSAATSPQQLG